MSEIPDSMTEQTLAIYRSALTSLREAGVPFLVQGAWAVSSYTGLTRYTKDIDVAVRPEHVDATCRALEAAGFTIQHCATHWLSKALAGDEFVDIIYGFGNGLACVDDEWFAHARDEEVLGIAVQIAPAEEILWSKAFIMERERFDGADVAHLIHDTDGRLDWQRLLRRFGPHWRVLLAHLVLFGYVYPGRADLVPTWVMNELLDRLQRRLQAPDAGNRLCRGTLVSRQFEVDVNSRGYEDARPPGARPTDP
ncbi:MAG: nucleotidyltransferase [Acidobacteria bacterium]|nr:nucleotidyltransferase [Acidobacteriota bacterium]